MEEVADLLSLIRATPVALVLLLSLCFSLLGLAWFLRGMAHRHAWRAISTLAANPDQVTHESLRAHCQPILESRLHAIQATAPRVRAISMKIDLAAYDHGWVPKSVPSPRLWLEPKYDRDADDLEVDRAELDVVRDADLVERLVGHIRPEQLTLASVLGGHRLIVRVGST